MILNSPTISGSLTVTGNIITSGSITLSGSVASASYAATASFVALAQSASNAVSAATASFANAFTVASTLTAQTLVVQTITSSVDFVTGSTRFGSLLSNTHVFSGSVTMNPGGLFVSSSGLVGIGNIIPAYSLDVSGTGRFTGILNVFAPSANYATLNLNGAAGYGAELKFGEATGGYLAAIRHNYNVGTGLEFYTGGLAAGNLRMYISPTGNVGIGTTSPGQLLEVVGGEIKAGRVDSSNEGGQISFGRSTDNATAWYIDAYGNTSSPQLRFVNVANSVVAMTLTGSYVGIGTSSPSAKFMVLSDTNTSATNIGRFAAANNTLAVGIGYETIRQTETNGSLLFETNATERMRISSNGNVNVGIGSAILEVGSTGLNGKLGIRFGGAGRVGIDTRDDDDSSNCIFIFFRKSDGTGIGSITRNGLTNAVLYNTTSDYRLKEDFKEINGLDKISAIKVYDFKWKGLEDRMDGVIAHELAEIMPYAVYGEKDAIDEKGNIVYQGVDYSKIVPSLIKAIQELKTQNDDLQSQINELKAQ